MKKTLTVLLALSLTLALLVGCASTTGTGASAAASTSVAAGESAAPSASTEATASASAATSENTSGDIAFTNILSTTNAGLTLVYGEAANSGSKAASFTLKISFYDKDKKLLGTAVGAVNDLNGGETTIFSAMASEDYSKADSYKVQVDTLVASGENKAKVIEFSNTVAKKAASLTTIEGEAKNTDTAAHSFTISVGAYDSANKLIGVSVGAVNDLAAGETKTFSTMSSEDLSSAETYKVFVTTIVQ